MIRPLALDKSGKLVLTEADVTEQVIGRLVADGFTCIKIDSGWDANLNRIYGEPGAADWLCLKRSPEIGRPHLVFLELKRPGKKPEAHQRAWADGMRRRGFDCRWVDGYDTGRRPLLSIYEGGHFYDVGC